MRSLRSSKCLKTTVELTFTTQKSNTCSPWTACSVFNWKCLFWVNLVQKLRIISLSWNFVPRLIQICRIPWWCSPFWANLVKKNQNVSLSWICKKTNLNKWNSIRMFTFSVFDHKYLSWTNLVQKFKIVCSKWNLIQRLIRICKTQWLVPILSVLDWK